MSRQGHSPVIIGGGIAGLSAGIYALIVRGQLSRPVGESGRLRGGEYSVGIPLAVVSGRHAVQLICDSKKRPLMAVNR